MKCITAIVLSLLVNVSYSQERKTYLKASPSVFLPNDKDASFGGYLAGGLKLHKFVSAGITGGYFNFEKESVIPLGVEVNLSNFESDKIKPILTAQAFYPLYKKSFGSYTDASGNDYMDIELKGKSMVGANAGISFPVDNLSLLITAGYSRLSLKGNGAFTNYTALPKGIESANMFTGSVSIVF
jgi:hypothetical protein